MKDEEMKKEVEKAVNGITKQLEKLCLIEKSMTKKEVKKPVKKTKKKVTKTKKKK